MDKLVDARGLACPLPVVHAKTALEEMAGSGVLTVLVDNEIAVQNLRKFLGSRGLEPTAEQLAEKEYRVRASVEGALPPKPAEDEEITCPIAEDDDIKKGMTVVLSANMMGGGDEKLGRTLMKAFIFALTKQDALPETILCYNSGAYLTCEGSESLDDLRSLAEDGVNILTCGTCLDFYGLKEKLAVGGVTNMYDIVELLERSARIIRP